MINFRYHILKKLGEGGSGEVFLVEDVLRERQLSAMKILHGENRGDSTADEQFRNEVSILSTLHHPHLVRVLDFGKVYHAENTSLRGRRFFTMEYLRGLTSLEWYHKLRSDQDRVRHLKHIALQVCGVLSYVHRQGIIHFDVKPENIVLVSDGEKGDELPLVKLTDFGFSVKQFVAGEISLRGTLQYTAPELLRRETFDHRVDLYSLGATLYHLIEDQCPFEANEPIELIRKVLTAEPEFQRCAGPAYSPFLSLVTNLLQKDPSRRFHSAREAARVLLAGEDGAEDYAVERASGPGFVGREKEKAQMISAMTSLGKESAGKTEVAILLSGPEGMGKTALLNEMTRFARTTETPVLEMSTSRGGVPFGAVLSILPLLRAEVLSRATEGEALAAKFVDVIDPDSNTPDGKTKELQDWMREKDNVIEARARFLHQASLLFPFIVVIDNADLMDTWSGEVVQRAIRDAEPGRLLFLAAARGESILASIASRIQLAELESSDVSAMSMSALGTAIVGNAIGNRLYQLYGGSPALIAEALHSVSALLPADVPGDPADLAGLVENVVGQLPRGIDKLLMARYEALDRGRQLSLDILSCFLSPARLEVIQSILPFPPLRVAAYLASLETDGFVLSSDGGQRFSMRHASLKSTIYSAMATNRNDIHSFIASTMEAIPGVRSFVELQELAHQYGESGKSIESMRWLEAAADEGMHLGAYQRARDLYHEAAAFTTDGRPADLERINLKHAQSLFNCGDFREAIDLTSGLLSRNPSEKARGSLHKIAGLAQSRLGEYEESKQHISVALACCTDGKEELELRQELIGIDIALGNFPEAEQAGSAQLDQAKHLGDPRILASTYTDLGITTFCQDKFDRSVNYFREAKEIYESLNQHARVADAMMNIGNVMSAKGDTVGAIEIWMSALTLSQEYGTLNQQAQIQNNLGIAHYKLKRFQEARTFYENAGKVFSRLDSKQGNAYVLTNLGEVCFAEGEYEKALMLWEDAGRFYRDMDDAHGIAETMLQLALVHLEWGAVESVARHLDEAERLIDERKLETFRVQLLYLRGKFMMFQKSFEKARHFFDTAEECSHDDGKIAYKSLLKIRMAECDYHTRSYPSAVALARNAMEEAEKEPNPEAVAEACLLLGMIAKASPSSVPDKALPLFRKGLDEIAKEPVAEITWKLALALGQEFRERGQSEKAKEFLAKAKLVLQFFIAQFKSSELKNQYLAVENKDKVLAAIESFLQM